MSDELAITEERPPVDIMPMPDISRMLARKQAIDGLVESVMTKDVHYGKVPGCGKKPALLKPGAEALCVAFNCRPEPVTTYVALPNDHREYRTTCRLIYIPTGQVVGEASATCTTMESKYRFRTGPKASTGVQVPREYWDIRKANPKKAQELLGGAGFMFQKEDDGKYYIWEKAEGVENPNIADTYNTIVRIAEKRALVAVTLIAFGVSDKFTQEPEISEKSDHDSTAATSTDNVPEPNGTGGAQPQGKQNTKSKADPEFMKERRQYVWGLLLEMTGGVEEEARIALKKLTAFDDFKGYDDINKVSDKVMKAGYLLNNATKARDAGEVIPF